MALITIAQGRVYNFSHVVGRALMGGAAFNHPLALVLGQGGLLYVVSRGRIVYGFNGSSRVSKITIGGPGDEEFHCEFGRYGEGDGQTIWPASVALDREGNVCVSDEWLHRISIFDEDGNFLDKWGTPGAGNGELNRPSGVLFDREDNLLIVDSHNHRIQKFTKDGSFLGKWGCYGGEEGEFNMPWGITMDSQGDIYVADWKNHRVQKFSPDGTFLASFGSFGTGLVGLNHPTDVAVDGEGDVYVCDWYNHRVQIFASDGEFITSLLGDAHELSKWAKWSVDANPDVMKARRRVKSLEPEWGFRCPTAVAFDEAKGHIIVADCQRGRLQVYIKDKSYVDPQFNL